MINSTFVFDAHVIVVSAHQPIAAIAPTSLAAAQSLRAAPGTSSLSLTAAPPAVVAKVLVCLCTFGYGHVAPSVPSTDGFAIIGQFGWTPFIT